MELCRTVLALFVIGLPVILCPSCKPRESTRGRGAGEADKPAAVEASKQEAKPADESSVEQKQQVQPVVEAAPAPPNVVAQIGDYVIAKEELVKRMMQELRPDPYEQRVDHKVVNANTVLMKMIAEKAMIMEAREQNYLTDEIIRTSLRRTTERNLIRLLLEKKLKERVKVEESEIEATMRANKLTREDAKQMLERTKAKRAMDEYYGEIYKNRNVKKLRDNFAEAAQIHLRLLLHPGEQHTLRFIRLKQVRDEVTAEEKNIVLATFDGGKVTLKDWFDALCDMSPPSRPKDLHTVEGVKRLLDRALMTAIYVAEAKSLGLDKDENLVKEAKEREDGTLLNEARRRRIRGLPEPDEKQIVAYFEKNKEAFGTPTTLRIDQIWCQDLKTAQKVKSELESGKDFESVRQEYSLHKEGTAFDTHPGEEGVFFQDLWKGEPNEIMGPVKGFYGAEIKWRVVKVLEKKPGKIQEYSDGVRNGVRMKMMSEQREAVLEEYRKELLKKYPYKVYDDRIKDIDLLNIP